MLDVLTFFMKQNMSASIFINNHQKNNYYIKDLSLSFNENYNFRIKVKVIYKSRIFTFSSNDTFFFLLI